jgi:aspartate aminotransferase-like enzyme
MKSQEFGRFFLPGPTEVRPEVLAAMVRPVIGHRGPDMERLLSGMAPGLKAVFQTERPVYVSTSSATGFMEAAITNLSRRKILCLVGGAFGQRFQKIAERTGRPVDALEVEWGSPHTPELVRDVLESSPGVYDLLTVVHSETSTGVLNPVADIAAVTREHEDLLIAVDGVTSVGGARVAFDEWGLDFLLTGSQKALALPPGLAFAAASGRAISRAREGPARSYYFDLVEFERRAPEFQTTNTPAVNLFYALEAQLARIAAEGLETRWARHLDMATRTWAWVAEVNQKTGQSLRVLAPQGHRSPTVTAVTLPAGLSGPQIVAAMRERGFTLAAGYGKLKASTIRIGHMGDHTVNELEELLEELGRVIEAEIGAPA